MITIGESIITSVVGVTFENRQAVVKLLRSGEKVRLIREPYNPHDTNAVRVERYSGEQIGYLNSKLAKELAPLFDLQGKPIIARVVKLKGGSDAYSNMGVSIEFTAPGNGRSSEQTVPGNGDSGQDFADKGEMVKTVADSSHHNVTIYNEHLVNDKIIRSIEYTLGNFPVTGLKPICFVDDETEGKNDADNPICFYKIGDQIEFKLLTSFVGPSYVPVFY